MELAASSLTLISGKGLLPEMHRPQHYGDGENITYTLPVKYSDSDIGGAD